MGKWVPIVRDAPQSAGGEIDRHNQAKDFGDFDEKAALSGLAAG